MGAPAHWHIAKSNLEPIEREEIHEEPTFYPYQPYSRKYPSEDSDCIEDMRNQKDFLVDNNIGSDYYRDIMSYHERYISGVTTPLAVINEVKKMIEESENKSPPLRCFVQTDWHTSGQVDIDCLTYFLYFIFDPSSDPIPTNETTVEFSP